ncbi:MAG: UDP-N-acetylglucosamine 2-epimerase (non-hydrolyzing) [Peptococcaceae bacterium]|nr:MAG: UDP-N-acetylglucosamine 2-epimerase (non-hydrolyzing) [Peptococcaceae bacterium]
MKIVTVAGARPQFIKMAPVSRELRRYFSEVIVHTGQHYDYEMDRIFFDQLEIPAPDYHLSVGSGSHGHQTGEMLKRIEDVLLEEKPDLVLTYGDTNSTLAGALAASKLNIKTAHVEAGMRSFDRSMPEEVNRVLTDHCSDLFFCSTETAVENLRREGIINGVYLTGDVMVDSLLHNRENAGSKSTILKALGLKEKGYLVATIHRAGNTDSKDNLVSIVKSFSELEEMVVFPVHPRTEKYLKKYGLDKRVKASVKLIKPLGYLDFLVLMSNAKKIITDSGGVQKEAYILKVPCITLRENTEWIETVEDGWNVLVGADTEKIVRMVKEFDPSPKNHRERYGSGNAGRRIADTIKEEL